MAEEWFQGRVATEAEDRALERGVSWGDWGRTVGIGMADFDKMVMSGARALSELQGDTAAADRFVAASRLAEMDREDRTEGMSEIARRRLLAGVTSEEFLSAPVSSTVLKMFRMSPMLAASVIPAGLPGVSGLVGVAAMGGALSAADVIDGIYDEVDAASDKDLRLAAPFYDELRNMGMSGHRICHWCSDQCRRLCRSGQPHFPRWLGCTGWCQPRPSHPRRPGDRRSGCVRRYRRGTGRLPYTNGSYRGWASGRI